MKPKNPVSARMRAFRTFLQSVCGMLAAVLLCALTGALPAVPGWQIALMILFSASAAALIARIMN